MDADTRSVVSRVKGWPAQGSLWAFDKKGAHTYYAKDVWDLIQDLCFLLRQFLSLLPPDCVIFVGAGSPCQDLTSIGRGKGILGLAGDRSVHIHCVWAVLYFLSCTPFWSRTVILVENAGSMRAHMKSYILSLLGIPSSCCHYINCSRWGSVTRARYFFSSSDIYYPSPLSLPCQIRMVPYAQTLILLPSLLRSNSSSPLASSAWFHTKGAVVQTPLAYHPKNLLYDFTYFGTWDRFCESCLSHLSQQYPEVPFKQFLPEFLWKEWHTLIDWKADFDSQLTQAILQTVTKLQEFYSNPYIYMPFRLPTLDEKAHESELTALIETTKQEANPPLRTLHNIIGNFFKPSAALAALGGTHSIQNFVSGATTPHQWAPSSPSKVNKDFITLRATVSQDIAALSELHPHIVERWFPRNIHQLDSDDFWHKATHMHTPPVFTSQLTSQPPLPSPSAPVLTFPLSMQIQTHVLQFDGLHDLLLLPVFYSYPLDRLISPGLPPFDSVALKHFLTSAHLRKLCFLKAYFSGWELYQCNTVALVFFEDANSVEMMAFGSISSYKQLFVFSFSSANDSFDYALLLQHMTPPPLTIHSIKYACGMAPPSLSLALCSIAQIFSHPYLD